MARKATPLVSGLDDYADDVGAADDPPLLSTSPFDAPVFVGVLGTFQLLKASQQVELREGGKVESLMSALALRHGPGASRDSILTALWPDRDTALATQSLNSLLYSLRRQLGDVLAGSAPVVHQAGTYRLNGDAGVVVDVAHFDALVNVADRHHREGDPERAVRAYSGAAKLYRGDLAVGADVGQVLERERLRARYLSVLARLSDFHFAVGDYVEALNYALRLLASDPCREDAHRVVMRCYVRRGERSQAMRQFRVCEEVLRAEFDAFPEAATTLLFEQVRLQPATV